MFILEPGDGTQRFGVLKAQPLSGRHEQTLLLREMVEIRPEVSDSQTATDVPTRVSLLILDCLLTQEGKKRPKLGKSERNACRATKVEQAQRGPAGTRTQ